MIDLIAQVDSSTMASFTVNVAVNSVALSVPVGDVGILYSSNEESWFQFLDHFTLISLGYRLPLGFEFLSVQDNLAQECLPSIEMRVKENGRPAAYLYPHNIFMPFDNYELNFGHYYNIPIITVSAEAYQIVFNFRQNWTYNVSMVNVPAALNGVTYYVPIFAKVEHTLDLLNAAP